MMKWRSQDHSHIYQSEGKKSTLEEHCSKEKHNKGCQLLTYHPLGSSGQNECPGEPGFGFYLYLARLNLQMMKFLLFLPCLAVSGISWGHKCHHRERSILGLIYCWMLATDHAKLRSYTAIHPSSGHISTKCLPPDPAEP